MNIYCKRRFVGRVDLRYYSYVVKKAFFNKDSHFKRFFKMQNTAAAIYIYFLSLDHFDNISIIEMIFAGKTTTFATNYTEKNK